jgi:hypothetical protein
MLLVRQVPEQFQAQSEEIANPPTFLFVLRDMLRGLERRNLSSSISEGNNPNGTVRGHTVAHESFINAAGTHEHTDFAAANNGNIGKDAAFLISVFPYLENNYQWFLHSQEGPESHSFRWRGRTQNHTLSSGMLF